MTLLDTNVLIWLATGNPFLGPETRAVIERAWTSVGIAASAISFWEIAMLRSKDRLPPRVEPAPFLTELRDRGMSVIDVTAEIGIRAGLLEGLHGDPADRVIVATALDGHELVTGDRQILSWNGPLRTIDASR